MLHHHGGTEGTSLASAIVWTSQTRHQREGRREFGAAPLERFRKNQNGAPRGLRRDGLPSRSTGRWSPALTGGTGGMKQPSCNRRTRSRSCPAGGSGSTSLSVSNDIHLLPCRLRRQDWSPDTRKHYSMSVCVCVCVCVCVVFVLGL